MTYTKKKNKDNNDNKNEIRLKSKLSENSQRFLETYSNPFAFLTPNFHKITEDAFNGDTFIHSADQLSFELLKNTITPYFHDKINGSI